MIKLNAEELEYMNNFEKMTKAKVVDCILKENDITFIVEKGNVGLAIGKKGSIVEKVKNKMGKEIHVYEYSQDPKQFIRNLMFPINILEVEIEKEKATVKVDPEQKKRAIGREGKKINNVREIMERHFGIKEIKVI